MKYLAQIILAITLLTTSVFGFDDTAPQADSAEPKIGRPGTVVRVEGRALDKTQVDEIFLTDHRFDMKVKVLEQSSTRIVFRIPPFVKPGRLQLLFLTAGKDPVYLEQPIFLLLEDGEEAPKPVEVSRKETANIEVASVGASVPVPKIETKAPPPGPSIQEPRPQITPEAKSPEASPKVEQPREVTRPEPAAAAAAAAERPVTAQPQPEAVASSTQSSRPAQPLPMPMVATTPASSDLVPAQLIRRSRVNYPSGNQAAHIEGAVELKALIRADGRVKDVKILKGNAYLASAAASSVMDWLYEPARLHGKPVESEVIVVLNFKRPE